MRDIKALKPERVFHYFSEIAAIPHGSYNVSKISEYLENFGKSHGFETYRDELDNVIIIKEASQGYENEPPIIMQGHMDMVAVSKPELGIDMLTTPLDLCINEAEDYLYAEGTSLGGDDGIAVAYALAILEDDSLQHPRLEIVITTNEEVGMEGAAGIDLSMLKGNRLLNLDSEEEGIFLTGCAGGVRINCIIPSEIKCVSGTQFDIEIGGLKGGHSGEEIDKERGNSNCLAGRLLCEVQKELNCSVYVVRLEGGLADNAIPRETAISLVIPTVDDISSDDICQKLCKLISAFESDISGELSSKDPDCYCKLISSKQIKNIKACNATPFINFLELAPNGVQAMSGDVKGLVETSLNLGIVSLDLNAGEMTASYCVRSSIKTAKEELVNKLVRLTTLLGGSNTSSGDYPGWKYRADSPLRDKMIAVYKKLYNKEPEVMAIHAGLECGLLGDKITDLDCVSIGPDMKDIHTTEEKLYISSTRRVYEYVCELLATRD